MSVQVDIPGIGTVQARNAATESTLRDLVNAINNLNKTTEQSGKSSSGGNQGGTSSGGSSAGAGMSAKAGQMAEKSASKMSGAFNSVSKAIGTFTGTLAGTGKAFTELGIKATTVIDDLAGIGNSIERAAREIDKIPLIGGVLSRALGPVASALTSTTKAYQDAAGAGANFGGSVAAMSRSAGEAGMTMDEFGSLIRSNGQAMLGLANNVEDGAQRFSQVSKALRTTGSDLYALGFSTQQINEGLANYSKQLRMQGLQGNRTNADLAKGAKSYLKEMDLLAKITGEERSAKEAEREALMNDAQFQASMAGLHKDVRDSFLGVVQQVPKGLQGFVKDVMATGTATSAESQLILSQMGETGALLTEFHAKQQRGEAVSMEERSRLNDLIAKEGPKALESIKHAAAASPELAPLVNALASTLGMQTDAVKGAMNAQNNATSATDGQAKAMEEAKATLAKFSNEFQMALVNTGLLDVLMGAFKGLAGFVDAVIVPAFKLFGDAINGSMNFIKEAFQTMGIGDVFGSIKDFTTKVFDSAREMMTQVSDFFMGIIKSIDWESVKTMVTDIFATSMEVAKDLFTTIKDLFVSVYQSVDWKSILDSAKTIFFTVKDVFDSLVTNFTPVFQDIGRIASDIVQQLMPIFSDAGTILKELGAQIAPMFQDIGEIIKRVVEVVAPLLRPILAGVGTVFGGFFDMLGGLVKIIKGLVTGDFSTIGEGIKQFFGGFVDRIIGLFEILKGLLSGGIRALYNFLTGGVPEQPPPKKSTKVEEAEQKQAVEESEAERKRLAEAQKQAEAQKKLEDERKQTELKKQQAAAKEKEAKEASIASSQKAIDDSKKVDLRAGPEAQFKQFAEQQKALNEKGKLVGMGQAPPPIPREPVKETAAAVSSAGEKATTGTALVGQPTDMNKYLKTIAMIESGGNPEAMAKTSSASGMFQFTKGTWEQMTKEMGVNYGLSDRFDPAKAEEVAAYFTSKQKGQLEKGIGREANATDLYMSHFLGAGGATKFLTAMGKDPSQSAAALDPRAAAANKNIYYDKEGAERSVQEVYDLMAKKVGRASALVDQGKIPEAVANIGSGKGEALGGMPGPMADIGSGKEALGGMPGPLAASKETAKPSGTVIPMSAASVTATATGPQETAESLLSQLNSNMMTLISLTRINNELTERQIGVSRSMGGDLFSNIG
jgi:hypothetical protein